MKISWTILPAAWNFLVFRDITGYGHDQRRNVDGGIPILYGIALKMVAAERRKQSRNVLPQPDTVRVAPENALWVRQALERLDPAEREILRLREFEQLSYAEIPELIRAGTFSPALAATLKDAARTSPKTNCRDLTAPRDYDVFFCQCLSGCVYFYDDGYGVAERFSVASRRTSRAWAIVIPTRTGPACTGLNQAIAVSRRQAGCCGQ
jgi:predicted DNA-binding protein (UPF0251 family)